MKNKKFTYLLLGAVVMLWGLVFFKIFAAVNEETVVAPPLKAYKSAYFNLVNHENDSVKITLDYRDPFAAITEDTPAETLHQKAGSQPQPLVKKLAVNWPEVSYRGFVTNPVTKQKIVLIAIQGKELMLSEGQAVNGLKMLRYLGDSIKLSYQNETKFIKLK